MPCCNRREQFYLIAHNLINFQLEKPRGIKRPKITKRPVVHNACSQCFICYQFIAVSYFVSFSKSDACGADCLYVRQSPQHTVCGSIKESHTEQHFHLLLGNMHVEAHHIFGFSLLLFLPFLFLFFRTYIVCPNLDQYSNTTVLLILSFCFFVLDCLHTDFVYLYQIFSCPWPT